MDQATLTFPNLPDFIADLNSLPAKVQQRLIRGAVATAAAVVKKAAKRNAPVWTGSVSEGHPPPGTLKESIYQTRLPEKCTSRLEVHKVDVRKGKKTTKKGKNLPDAFYASWVEYGHFTRTPRGPGTRKARREAARASGKARWVPPQPFMRPAFEANKEAALQAMAEYLRTNIAVALEASRYVKALAA